MADSSLYHIKPEYLARMAMQESMSNMNVIEGNRKMDLADEPKYPQARRQEFDKEAQKHLQSAIGSMQDMAYDKERLPGKARHNLIKRTPFPDRKEQINPGLQ